MKFQHALWFILSVMRPSDEDLQHIKSLFQNAEADIQKKALESFKAYSDMVKSPFIGQHSPQQIANAGLITGIFVGLASLASEEFRTDIEKTAADMAPDPEKIISFKLARQRHV